MLPLSSTHYNAERREWSGPIKKDIYNDAATLGEVIYEALRKNSKKIIQIYDVTGESMTCEELLKYSENLSKYLILELGLKVGDVIGLCGVNTAHVATLMFASFLCGTPINPLFPGFDKATICSIFKVTQPKIIFCDVENYEIIRGVNEELNLRAPIFVLNGDVEDARNIQDLLHTDISKYCKSFRFPCLDLHGDDTAMIICSSGTTGPPKGALCSNRSLLNQKIFLGVQSTSVLFGFIGMYWISGVWTLVESLVNPCLCIVTDKPFTPEYFLDLIRRHQITHVVSNASHLTQVAQLKDVDKIRQSFASIDSIYVGGAKVPFVMQEEMHEILSDNLQRPGLVVGYGITELGGVISYNGKYLSQHLIGAEGKLAANITIRIVSKENELLGPNEHGEICVSSPYTWFGYYKNEEATHRAKRGNWLYTGDIGYIDDEGFVHVCTRDKDIFKSGNCQIYPQIIEDIILRLKGVSEVCIFSIPDLEVTHLIGCIAVRTPNDVGRSLKSEDIDQWVMKNIGDKYHLSGGVYFVDALPRTGSGKIKRNNALEMVMDMEGKVIKM